MNFKRIAALMLAFILMLSPFIPAHAASVISYSDVSSNHWAYSAITEMTRRELFSGTSVGANGVGTFSPNYTMTRAQFIAVLTRFLYPNELKSMSPGKFWYSNNYFLAIKHGLLSSEEFDHGTLTVPCSRQDMAMLLVRVAYTANGEVATNLFPTARIADYDSISPEFQSYVLQSFSLGLLAGIDSKGTFQPKESLTRAQAATVIYRLIDVSTRPYSPTDKNISFTWRNGIRYDGEYQNGEANGFGKMQFPDIGTYTGYFVNGKREGIGTFQWNAGDKYVGMWNHDKMHGEGTYTYSDGAIVSGVWKDNSIAAEALSMEPSSIVLTEGMVGGIVARITPEMITEEITWTSSNETVAEVDGKNNFGKIIAKVVGTTVITASTDSGKKTTCTVTVKSPIVQRIDLNYGDYHTTRGNSVRLTADIFPENASKRIEWSSSDSTIAEVDQNGEVVTNSRGRAIISAETENGLIATCYFFVY